MFVSGGIPPEMEVLFRIFLVECVISALALGNILQVTGIRLTGCDD